MADVVLGQDDLVETGEALRLVRAQPENLGQREALEGGVGDPLPQPVLPDPRRDLAALGGGAAVTP